MKSTGVVRPLDKLGRLVIPKEIRNARGWQPGTKVEIYVDKDSLVIKEYHEYACSVCGAHIDAEYPYCPNCGAEQEME